MIESLMTLVQLAWVFAKLSLLSFGGGTAILAEMEREVVGHGWLTHQQFMQSYAIGQLTPGPGMTMVIPVGYQTAGVAGGIVAVVAFFAPAALIALALATIWGRVRHSPWPTAFRKGLLPVGVGLTLASLYTLAVGSLHDMTSMVLALTTFVILMRTKLPAPVVLLAGGVVGAALLR